MKTRITLVFAALLFGLNMSFAQQDEECMTNLTIFTDYYKSKKYDEAYSPWMKVRNKCPKFNRAIYAYGEKILEHKIENSTGADKVGYINDLMKLWDEALVNFSSNYSNGEVLVDKAELMYDHKKELGLNDKQIYDAFDKAFKTDLENFSSPRGLYIYFSTLVDLHNAGQAPIQDVFNKYDDVTGKIETEKDAYTKKTCLWSGGNFEMPEKKRVEPILGSIMQSNLRSANERSKTPKGFAIAVFKSNN